MKKCHLLLLTCASTGCVHLELVIDYRCQFLLLYFLTPKSFISDNFSTFKSKEVTDFLGHYNIFWGFILQKSPWSGRFYEKLKMPLKKIIGEARFSNDKLVTVICEIENSMNSRPLTYLTMEL